MPKHWTEYLTDDTEGMTHYPSGRSPVRLPDIARSAMDYLEDRGRFLGTDAYRTVNEPLPTGQLMDQLQFLRGNLEGPVQGNPYPGPVDMADPGSALQDMVTPLAGKVAGPVMSGLAGITMPVGGRGTVGLLGKTLPRASSTLDEMVEKSGYQVGTAPGVYEHASIEPRRGLGRVSAAERKMVNTLPPRHRKEAASMISSYRGEHLPSDYGSQRPKLGWEPFAAKNVGVSVADDGKETPVVNWLQQSPMFHVDPATGRSFQGEARARQVETVSNSMVDEVQGLVQRAGAGDANAQFIVDQSRWYKDAADTIKGLFGLEKGRMYADIQGGLSPNNRLSEQHKAAQEVFERFTGGDFDEPLRKFDAHMSLKPGGVTDFTWAGKLDDKDSRHYDPSAIIRKKSGKKYGMGSIRSMLAIRGLAGKLEPGMAPKMRNFSANLFGESVDPTVDVWAGRTIQRLSGLPRIPPKIDKGVPGAVADPSPMFSGSQLDMMEKEALRKSLGRAPTQAAEKLAGRTPKPDITGQYGLAADVYRAAAAKLGMDASDLQALMWFREKEMWEQAGWTPVDKQPSLVELIKQDNQRVK